MAREHAARARALACALVALAVPRAAAALTLAQLSASEMEASDRAPLDLYLNSERRGAVEVVLRDGDALASVKDLEAAGLRALEGQRFAIDGRAYVSLASLAPSLRYEVDERALALRLTAGQEMLGRSAIDLRPASRPEGLELGSDASGFLNYSVQVGTDDRTSGFAEAGASHGGRLLYGSGQLLADGTTVRGLSSLTVDDVDHLRRLVLGDGFAMSSGLGGGVLLGGVSLAREYGLDPYVIRSPMPRLSGFASTPSKLDVYVNGVLRREVPLPPGGYDVSNLPVTAGAGNVRTVLQDAFGRTEVLSWQYYYTPSLLGPGLSDYQYALGFRRLEYGRESFEYGRPVLVARHRAGVGDAITIGGRLDAAEDLASGGPSATLGLPFGTLDLEAAGSVEDGEPGAAASVGYSFVSRRYSGGALVRLLSDAYAHAALRAATDRARIQTSVFVGAPIASRVTAGLNYSLFDRRDSGLSHTLTARTDLLVARNLTLGVTGSATRDPAAGTGYELFAALSWAFARSSVADVSLREGSGDTVASAGVQRGLPAGTGLGYRAQAVSGPTSASTGLLQYQWDHGRYELQYDRVAGIDRGTATVAGGAVFLGGRMFLSRPVQGGYALIRARAPGVRGYAEGQEIGRTDSRGDLLVPTLLPYYGNRLAIADRDVPIEYRIGQTELLAAPTFRGGVVKRFAVEPLRAVEGELVTAAGARHVPPAYGEMVVSVAGAAFSSPIGGDGRFYLEGVPAGTHAADVEWSGGRCRATLVISTSPPVVDLGQLPCAPDAATATPAATTPSATANAPIVTPSATESMTATPTATANPPAPESASPTPSATATTTKATQPGPRRTRAPRRECPACGACVTAAIERTLAVGETCSRVEAGLDAFPGPPGSPSQTARACLVADDWEEQCSRCVSTRRERRCPSWPRAR